MDIEELWEGIKIWFLAAVVISIVIILLYVVFMFLGAAF